ncbi:MAG TPA: GGDEF domain-containing protein [Phycisphaerae bacterium]
MKNIFLDHLVTRGVLTAGQAARLAEFCQRGGDPIGFIAVSQGLLSGTQIDDILNQQSRSARKFGEIAVELRMLRAAQVDTLLQIQQLRAFAHMVEALALAGAAPLATLIDQLADFLAQHPAALTSPPPECVPELAIIHSSQQLLDQLKSLNRLPTPPSIALRVLELVRKENVTFNELARTIGSDPALSVRVLKFVNSSAVGLRRPVSSLYQAVPLVGLRGIKLMALSFSLLSTERRAACRGFDFDRFWSRSLACGVAARAIAQLSDYDPEEAFMAGIVAHIGQLVMACGVPTVYLTILQVGQRTGRDLLDVEREALGTTHVALGAALLRDWKLPAELCDAVERFCEGGQAPFSAMKAGTRSVKSIPPKKAPVPLTRILHAADRIAGFICASGERTASQSADVAAAVTPLFAPGLTPEELVSRITSDWRACGAILSIPTDEVKPHADILAEAQDRMTELSLATHLENQQIHETNNELKSKVLLDKLTGIPNRAAFDERWLIEKERAMRAARPLALLMVDVDHFKLFNDAHGHSAGDVVLQEVARTLSTCARRVDFVARYGGEEFVVIAPETSVGQAAVLAERLRSAVAALRVRWESGAQGVTVSVGGAACARPTRRHPLDDLIRCADEQLYAAKRAGRDRCRVVDPARSAAPTVPRSAPPAGEPRAAPAAR